MGDLSHIPSDTPPDDGGYTPLPVGDYDFEIEEREVADNKEHTGKNLRIKFKHLASNRTLQQWLAIDHENEDTERIARGKLAALSRASGLPGIPNESKKLIGRKLVLKLGVEPWEYNGKSGMQNTIKGYSEFRGSAAKTAPKTTTKTPTKTLGTDPSPIDDDDIPF